LERRLRVAVVAYTEYPWDPRVRSEAETLVREGYEVHVIAVRPTSGRSPLVLDGVRLWEVPLTTRRGAKVRYAFQYAMFLVLSSLKLWRLHKAGPFDLVHVHSLPDFQVLSTLPLKLQGVPVLLDLHEAMPEIVRARFRLGPGALLIRTAILLEAISCRYADHVIAANDGIRAALVGRGVPGTKVTTVYNAGDVQSELPSPDTVRRELGLPNGPLIVHAGGINPERDLETLVRSIPELASTTDVHLVIAGNGDPDYVASIQDLVAELGLSPRVHFLGRVPREKALALMSLSTVGLVTLESNPLTELAWPTRIVEFANLGKPLVMPDLRFIRETLGAAARYYAPGNASDLSRVLNAALHPPELNVSSAAVVQEIADRFNSSASRERFVSVCRNLV
jgi:glycosyltransferase involved in cell wall biosynthesis